MPGIDKPTGRVIALIVLLVLTAAALRGYLPAAQRGSRHRAPDSPTALVLIVALLAISLGIVAVAIINRMRNRQAQAGSAGALRAGPGGTDERPSWRVLLIGFAVLVAWLLIVWLLTRFVGQHRLAAVVHVPGHSNTPSIDTTPSTVPTAPPMQRPVQNPASDTFGYLAAAATIMLVLIAAAMVGAARARRRGLQPPGCTDDGAGSASPAGRPQSLVRAAELGLAEVGDPGREPREAIIACYAAMERELAHVPDAAPQDFDTPTEVLARAVEHHALPADNAARLVRLFAEARFSPHLMTERHRADAIRILRLVLDEMRHPA